MFDRLKFYVAVRATFGKFDQAQVDTFNAILDEWERRGGGDVRHLAYMLATAWHECRMRPIREVGRGRGKRYGTTFYGRGLVQLTWEENYRRAGAKIGVDLVHNPDLALDLAVAVKVMFDGMADGWFTGKRLATYFNATKNDPTNARRIINGADKAALIAGYHGRFLSALRNAATATAAAPAPQPKQSKPEIKSMPVIPAGFFASPTFWGLVSSAVLKGASLAGVSVAPSIAEHIGTAGPLAISFIGDAVAAVGHWRDKRKVETVEAEAELQPAHEHDDPAPDGASPAREITLVDHLAALRRDVPKLVADIVALRADVEPLMQAHAPAPAPAVA